MFKGAIFNQFLHLSLIVKVEQSLESLIKGYIQGHRHTLEHVQQPEGQDPSDLHFFTIGAGALYCTSCIKKDIMGEIDMNIGTLGNIIFFTQSKMMVKVNQDQLQ